MADLHDLAAAYALDALDREEREEFERHLAGCDRCRADVALYAESAGQLADATAVPPPPHLKKAVMDALDERETPVVASISRQRRNRTFSIAIAAALVAIVATAAVLLSNGGLSEQDVLAAPDAMTVELLADGLDGTFTYSVAESAGVFQSQTLPALRSDKVYALWLIDGNGPSPAGLFVPNDDGDSSALVEDVRTGLVIGLTVEPAGGSPQPTGDVLLSAPIG